MLFRFLVLAISMASLVASAHAQDPAELGPHAVTEWDAGRVMAATLSVPTVVVYPNDVGPHPIVGVFHGFEGESVDHQLMARTLASYGLVVVRSTMPCRLTTGCDHDANAAAISALLDWAVAQSAMGGTTLSGRVDGSRRGLVGHSFGALNVHIAGTRDASIDSVVLIDPNDDTGVPGRLASASVTAATAQILAALPGTCNSLWDETAITPMLPAPKLELTVSRSGHCDPTDAADPICVFGCGGGDRTTSAIFRRYTVAWTVCNLIGDPAMAPWLGGAGLDADEEANVVRGVTLGGEGALRCRDATFDGGFIIDDDAGAVIDGGEVQDSGANDGGALEDGGTSAMDAGRDGGASAIDAGTSGVAGGCACRADRTQRGSGWILALLAAVLVRRRQVPKRTPSPASAQSAGMRP
jgi:MYXO-CTERM domain-containing protein